MASTLLIANAGAGTDNDRLTGLADALPGDVERVALRSGDDLPARVRDAKQAVERIVLCGGDGTVNWALDALLDAERPVGLIPSGTANDLARSLGIPDDPWQAIEIIRDGHQRKIDVARANGKSFINALGIGLGPLTTRAMDSDEKAKLGVGAYFLGLIRALRRAPHFEARIRSEDDVRQGRFLQITIANGIHYGGGMTVSAQARLDDGRLDVLLVRASSRWQLLANALRFKTGWTDNSELLDHWQCRSIEVETTPDLDVTADGEFLLRTPLKCEILPQALTLFAPETGQ